MLNSQRSSRPDQVVTRGDFEAELIALIPALRAFACRLAGMDGIDDLVQETLYKALKNRHQFQPGTNLKAWLFTIMRHDFCTEWTIRNRERVVPPEDLETPVMPGQEWSLYHAQVAAAIARLNPKFRKALMLVGEGESYRTVANECGCKEGTVKSRVNRARHTLSEEFSDIFAVTDAYATASN